MTISRTISGAVTVTLTASTWLRVITPESVTDHVSTTAEVFTFQPDAYPAEAHVRDLPLCSTGVCGTNHTIAGPWDLHADGEATILDLMAFLEGWWGDGADYTNDGTTNILDLLQFMDDWHRAGGGATGVTLGDAMMMMPPRKP